MASSTMTPWHPVAPRQVRRQVADPDANAMKAASNAPVLKEDKEEEEPLLIKDMDPPKLPSKSEKEPQVRNRPATMAAAAASASAAAPSALPAASLPAAASLQEIAEEPKKAPFGLALGAGQGLIAKWSQ
eukprot:s1316_g16.t1